MNNWLPKSVLCLKSYRPRLFMADVLAGITVGLVALPLAMAFAIASGVPPQTGLYCAIVAGFAISALGGSSTQIGGPTGAVYTGENSPCASKASESIAPDFTRSRILSRSARK